MKTKLQPLISFTAILLMVLLFSTCKKEGTAPGSLNGKSVGASAGEMLSSSKYKKMTIELLYMPGFNLEDATISNLKSFLESSLNKPGGISVVSKQITSKNGKPLQLSEVQQAENSNRTAFTKGDEIGVSVLITDGEYADNTKVLGIAYLNTSIVMFGKTIQDHSGGVTQPSRVKLETTVLEHEFGHLLGLVNTGSPMQQNHQDSQNGYHCNDSECLMYYAAETTEILGFLLSNNAPDLNTQCKADLKANGGK